MESVVESIHLAVAPVFLLTGVATKLAVLTSRLARIIDRSRVVEEQLRAGPSPEASEELDALDLRIRLIYRAITLTTACGLLVCLVIALLFVGTAFRWTPERLIAATFTGAVLSLVGSFAYLLREVFVATRTMARRRERRASPPAR